jgi:hypothetical protein
MSTWPKCPSTPRSSSARKQILRPVTGETRGAGELDDREKPVALDKEESQHRCGSEGEHRAFGHGT